MRPSLQRTSGVAGASGRGTHLLLRLGDAGVMCTILWFSLSLYGYGWQERYTLVATTALVLYFISAEHGGVFQNWRSSSLSWLFRRVIAAWLAVIVGLLLLAYATKSTGIYSRLGVSTWFLLTPLGMIAWRASHRHLTAWLARSSGQPRRVAVVGNGELAVQVIRVIDSSPWMDMALLGRFDDGLAQDTEPFSVAGSTADLLQLGQRREVDVVYIALPMHEAARITSLVDAFADSTVSVYVVPDYFVSSLSHSRWLQLGELPIVSVYETPFFGIDGAVKRAEDLMVASVAMAVFALPMALIATAIMVTSPGPVIFKQRRYGLGGEEFTIWKFRTMTVCEDGELVRQAERQDPRVTRLGSFLRGTSLDEMPQLFNVLQGSMSIVGPRPHPCVQNDGYREAVGGYMLRYKVKPGITGWAQINGYRGTVDSPEMLHGRTRFDLWYIRNWTLWLDLKIIALTLRRGFRGDNAY